MVGGKWDEPIYTLSINIIGMAEMYRNRNKYVGEFMNGLFHGQGKYTISSNGYSYIGDYRIGSLWNGTMKVKDGTIDYQVVNWKKIKQ